jgi:PAS domain S-box-containing protein
MDRLDSSPRLSTCLPTAAEWLCDWVWELNEQLRVGYVSEAIGDATGFSPAHYLSREWGELLSSTLSPDVLSNHLAALQARKPFRKLECSLPTRQGSEVWVTLSGVPVFSKDGRFAGYCGTAHDVTEQRLGRTKLIRSLDLERALVRLHLIAGQSQDLKQKLGEMLEVILDIRWLSIKPRGAVFLVEDRNTLALIAQVGLDRRLIELCAMVPFGKCLCGRAASRRESIYASCVTPQHEIHFPGMTPHGHYCIPIQGETGDVIGVLNTYVDAGQQLDPEYTSFLQLVAGTLALVIERHWSEEQVRKLSLAIEQSPASVVITDREGAIEYVNPKVTQVTGYGRDELLGQNPRVFKSGRLSAAVYEQLWATITSGKEWQGEFHNRRKSGDIFVESARISPLRNTGGNITHFLAIKEDVTERRALENQLLHAQKMESIGQLAAGIAHEINTPTQYAGDNLRFLHEGVADIYSLIEAYDGLAQALASNSVQPKQLAHIAGLKEQLDADYLMREMPLALEQALQGIAQIARIVQAMKQFAHPGTAEKAAVDLNKALQSTLTVARNEWKYVADLELSLDPDLPPIYGFAGDLNQAFLNIIVNAAHAIETKLGKHPSEKGQIAVTTTKREDIVEIRIADTGAGIAEAIRGRIFDPFFTTKEVGKGTGQGLTITHAIIVKRHGGRIDVQSRPHEGTTFVIRLPVSEPETAWDA